MNGRIRALDGVKFFSIILIFWWHCSLPSPQVDLGARACEMFFLCSGFLVGLKNAYDSKWVGTWKESCNYVFHKVIKFYVLYCFCNLFWGVVNHEFSSRGWGIEVVN